MGSFSQDMFGPSTNWNLQLVKDFFAAVDVHWLETFHVDGFRYDCVPNYWTGAFGGYAEHAYTVWKLVESRIAQNHPDYQRFRSIEDFVVCAEQLEAVDAVLYQTYSTTTWQNNTLGAAKAVAAAQDGAITQLGHAISATNLPTEVYFGTDRVPKAPLQYIENHDHSRFICEFGTSNDEQDPAIFQQGDRDQWFRVQPYLVATLLAKGIPLIWQGQELMENYWVPPQGNLARVGLLRPVRWEYFYDHIGRGTIALVRKLLGLRKSHAHLRHGSFYFFDEPDRYQNRGLLLFAWFDTTSSDYTLVAINFSGQDQWAPFWFPLSGSYREELHGGALDLHQVSAYQEYWIQVPGNYARIWTAR